MRALFLLVTLAASVMAQTPTCSYSGQFIVKDDCSGYYRCVGLTPIKMPACPENMLFSKKYLTCVIKGSQFDDCSKTTTPACKEGTYVRDEDCRGYRWCVNSQYISMPRCPGDQVFSMSALTCVPRGNLYDDCTTGSDICAGRTGLIPHPVECQTYYNCSYKRQPVTQMRTVYAQYMLDCPYPQYFNVQTQRCDPYSQVVCGGRTAYKDKCDYRRHQCTSSHCIPCYVHAPSCEGREDGDNEHAYRKPSFFYVICKDERFVEEKTCTPDANGRGRLFYQDTRTCRTS